MSALTWTAIHDVIQKWIRESSGLAGDHVIWAEPDGGGKRPSPPYISLSMIAPRRVGLDWVERTRNIVSYTTGGVFTADPVTDRLTIAGHGLATGDGPVRVESVGTLPDPLEIDVDYWAIVIDSSRLQLARSFFATISPASPIDLVDAGVGVHQLSGGPTFVRQGAELRRRAQGMRVATMTITCFAKDPIDPSGASAILSDVVGSTALYVDELTAGGVGIADTGVITQMQGRVGTMLEAKAVTTLTMHLASEVTATGHGYERVEVTRQSPATDVLQVPED